MKYLFIILTYFTFAGCDLKSSKDYHSEANQLEKQEKYREAIQLLDRAIEKDQKNIKAILDRAVDKSMIQDFKGAIEDYTMVIKIDPKNGLALLNRGRNRMRIEDRTGAVEDFDKAISTSYITINKNP